MNGKITFALVGCGRISQKHLEAIANLNKEAKLACVCDLIRERAEAAAVKYLECTGKTKPEVYTSLDKMLDNEKIDVLSICTPSGMHPSHGIKAALKHINVICEKPIATNLKGADKLIKACDEAQVKLFVVKQNRLNSTMRLLKKAVDKNRFGKIHMILSNVLWSRPQSYYDKAKWRGTWEFDGGAFTNQASHYIDILEWLGGPVESVAAVTGTLGRNIETEDTGSAIIRFRSGTIGNINVTMLAYPSNFEGSITILGEKGIAKVGGVAINRIEKWEFEDTDEDDGIIASSCYNPPNVYGFGHTGYYENVMETMRGNSKPSTDGREARKSLEIIMGIYRSSKEGKTIYLPLDLH